MNPKLPKLRPIAIKNRFSILQLGKGKLHVDDSGFVWIDHQANRIQIPIGSVTCLMLEPGTSITHAAMELAAKAGTLIIWIGDGGTRLYSAGQPGGARSDKLLYQAKLALDEQLRLKVVRKMFELRFGEPAPQKRSIAQLQSLEGQRVKALYKHIASQYNLEWKGRKYDPKKWEDGDLINRCISTATSCLYGITEAAILAAGYAPAIGFLHTGKPRSFVFDIADIFKATTVLPIAFGCAATIKQQGKTISTAEQLVRYGCRDTFRKTRILKQIIPTIEDILAAGEIDPPQPTQDHILPAIPNEEVTGDDGHRY